MPLIAAAALPAITAGLNAGGQIFGALQQNKMNRQSRRFAEKMYTWQRNDALADWKMQNEYNHPSAQMARLREAGLNPNLVYDNGAQMASATVRSSSPGSYNPRPPVFDPGAALGAFTNTQIQQAQVDNLRKQNTLLENEGVLKALSALRLAAEIPGVKSDSDKKGSEAGLAAFNLDMARGLKDNTIAMANAQLRKLMTDTDIAIDANERAELQNVQSLQEGAQRIINLRISALEAKARTKGMEIDNMVKEGRAQEEIKKAGYERQKLMEEINNYRQMRTGNYIDQDLKQLDLNLRRMGINPNDPTWQRILVQSLERMREAIK